MSALRGLYAITADALCADASRLLPAAAAALRGGARLLQYRDKRNPPAQREALARALLERCRQAGAALIVNDDLALAAAIGADGVHLGRRDGDARSARLRLGPQAIVGVTCHASIAQARAAQAAGASYVAFGRFFPSHSKPDAPPAPPGLIARARAELALPICAIGGLTPDNAAALIADGADLVAAIDGVFGAADIEAAARRYARLFEPSER